MTDHPLPPYTHIPGVTPHPIRDPAGHSFAGTSVHSVEVSRSSVLLAWEELPRHPEFLLATKLFNAGYYWESHEAWESLWHAAGRSGVTADFLKGLIKLAAAGVKLREHNRSGVDRHARRALELFHDVQDRQRQSGGAMTVMPLVDLIQLADALVHHPPDFPDDRTGRPVAALAPLPETLA